MQTTETEATPRDPRPLYPMEPIRASEATGELLYAFGRLFARGPDSRWHIVEIDGGGTDD